MSDNYANKRKIDYTDKKLEIELARAPLNLLTFIGRALVIVAEIQEV